MSQLLSPSDHLVERHGLEPKRRIAGHRVVVSGEYWSNVVDKSGHRDKVRVDYREEFTLAPHEHRLHGQGALSAVLGHGVLEKRLREKDKNFRALASHSVDEHENLCEAKPEPETPEPETPEQEAEAGAEGQE